MIRHSDRGTQFTSHECRRFPKDHDITPSVSAVGHCAENAAAEGFLGMLERERVNRTTCRTGRQGRADIFDYIERLHDSPVRENGVDPRGRERNPKTGEPAELPRGMTVHPEVREGGL